MAKTAKPVPDGYQTVTPQLTLDNCAQAIDWYTRGLGARELSRSVGPDGKIMHAETPDRRLAGDAQRRDDGQKGPKAFGGSPASLWLYVEDSDTLFRPAVGAGAEGGDADGRPVLGRPRRRGHRSGTATRGGSPRARKTSRATR